MRTLKLCAWDRAFNVETFVFVFKLSKIIKINLNLDLPANISVIGFKI